MALPKYTETRYRIWHYIYLGICSFVFFFLIAPLFVIFPLSFNAEEFLVFSDGMKRHLDQVSSYLLRKLKILLR